MNAVQALALALGAGWAAGINLYAAILTIGLMGSTGAIHLPPNLQLLTHPLIIGAAGFMFIVEFFVDKVPGLDSLWDAIHTFIRIPAGAVLAAQAIGPVDEPLKVAAGLVGGAFAASSHFTKAGTRVLINTSPEPFSNWAASLTEDVLVIAGVWTALQHPYIFLALLCIFAAAVIWALPKLFRAIRSLLRWIVSKLTGGSASVSPKLEESSARPPSALPEP